MRGILLVNVGTPSSCDKTDVKKFIAAMLSDPYLFGTKEWIARFLANTIIAPLSCTKSQEKYKLIWRKKEPMISPIIYHMKQLARALEKRKGVPVEIAMRYGEPDIVTAFKALEKKCPLLHEVVVFPLFPQYAQSTTLTAIEAIGNVFYKHPYSFRLKIVEPYYDHPEYIHALVSRAQPYIDDDIQKLVFVYHSLPLQQVKAGWKKGKEFDYVYQLKETNRLFCEAMQIPSHEPLLLYSSQRSRNWLRPFLDDDIVDLPKLGWKKVAVLAPGFTCDNMETLYDIDIRARELFMNAGGEKLVYIPALNASPVWVEAVWNIISRV